MPEPYTDDTRITLTWKGFIALRNGPRRFGPKRRLVRAQAAKRIRKSR